MDPSEDSKDSLTTEKPQQKTKNDFVGATTIGELVELPELLKEQK